MYIVVASSIYTHCPVFFYLLHIVFAYHQKLDSGKVWEQGYK